MKNPFLIIFCLIVGMGCSTLKLNPSSIIRIKGSTTFLNLTHDWAETYMTQHPDVSIYVDDIPSRLGIQALINGQADICAVSRLLKPEEVRQIAKKYNTIGLTYFVAKDAICFYVHPDNPLSALSEEQVKDILTGKLKTWHSLNREATPIHIYSRTPNSGTYQYLKDHFILSESFSDPFKVVNSTAEMIRNVEKDPLAFGYGGYTEDHSVKYISINGITPSIENIQSDSYPLTRYLYLILTNEPKGNIADFVQWTQGPEGQRVAREAGFIPLWPADQEQASQ